MLGCLKETTKPTTAAPAPLGKRSIGRGFRSKGCPHSVAIPKGAEGLSADREKPNSSFFSSDSISGFASVGSWPPGPTQGAKLSSCCAARQGYGG